MSEAIFINPYNFFPFTEKKKLAADGERNLTGVIEYSLYTKTPLFIPNTSASKAFLFGEEEFAENDREKMQEHKTYDFFSYTNLCTDGEIQKDYRDEFQKPIIPGSEIKGMFRSYYEMLTESCMSSIDDDVVLGKRTAARFRPGLLRRNKDGSYDLLEAEDYLWRTKGADSTEDDLGGGWKTDLEHWRRACYKQKLDEGQKVWFEKADKAGRNIKARPLACKVSVTCRKNSLTGYVIMGEEGPKMRKNTNKHCCHIFCEKSKSAIKRNVNIQILEQSLREYQKNGAEQYKKYRECFMKFKADAGPESRFPVYYSSYGGTSDFIMLSPACITREIYKNRLKDMLGSFNSCSSKKELCSACSLFGMTKDGISVASRIRFTDMQPEERGNNKEYYEKPYITLAPLASPKINNMEFYVKQPENAIFWTYDYYVDENGKLKTWIPELSGRKFYWHQPYMKLPEGISKTNQNITVRPVKKGVVFRGKLYFQNLSKQELNQLIWLLNAGETGLLADRKHGYKLGMAKPLGLGSVAVSVDRVALRELVFKEDLIDRVEKEYDWTYQDATFNKDVMNDFLKMTDFYAVTGRVSYPITKDQSGVPGPVTDGYEWFTQNHRPFKVKTSTSRETMEFREHMVPMEPELQKVSSGKPVGERQQKSSGKKPYYKGENFRK